MAIGENIRDKRLDLHMTMQELADKVGVTQSTINKWEKGYINDIPIHKLELVAKALETDVDYLLDLGPLSSTGETLMIDIEKRMRNLDNNALDRLIAYAEYLKKVNR